LAQAFWLAPFPLLQILRRHFFETMDKAKGASSGRTLASYHRSARKAARAGGIPHVQQGDLGEAAFVYKALSLGLVVAKPYGNMHRYDFMVDGGNGLSRVQVKACATVRRLP
jgi:hypothetical protein